MQLRADFAAREGNLGKNGRRLGRGSPVGAGRSAQDRRPGRASISTWNHSPHGDSRERLAAAQEACRCRERAGLGRRRRGTPDSVSRHSVNMSGLGSMRRSKLCRTCRRGCAAGNTCAAAKGCKVSESVNLRQCLPPAACSVRDAMEAPFSSPLTVAPSGRAPTGVFSKSSSICPARRAAAAWRSSELDRRGWLGHPLGIAVQADVAKSIGLKPSFEAGESAPDENRTPRRSRTADRQAANGRPGPGPATSARRGEERTRSAPPCASTYSRPTCPAIPSPRGAVAAKTHRKGTNSLPCVKYTMLCWKVLGRFSQNGQSWWSADRANSCSRYDVFVAAVVVHQPAAARIVDDVVLDEIAAASGVEIDSPADGGLGVRPNIVEDIVADHAAGRDTQRVNGAGVAEHASPGGGHGSAR